MYPSFIFPQHNTFFNYSTISKARNWHRACSNSCSFICTHSCVCVRVHSSVQFYHMCRFAWELQSILSHHYQAPSPFLSIATSTNPLPSWQLLLCSLSIYILFMIFFFRKKVDTLRVTWPNVQSVPCFDVWSGLEGARTDIGPGDTWWSKGGHSWVIKSDAVKQDMEVRFCRS